MLTSSSKHVPPPPGPPAPQSSYSAHLFHPPGTSNSTSWFMKLYEKYWQCSDFRHFIPHIFYKLCARGFVSEIWLSVESMLQLSDLSLSLSLSLSFHFHCHTSDIWSEVETRTFFFCLLFSFAGCGIWGIGSKKALLTIIKGSNVWLKISWPNGI